MGRSASDRAPSRGPVMSVHSLPHLGAAPRTIWLPSLRGHRVASWLSVVVGLVSVTAASVVWARVERSTGSTTMSYRFALSTAAIVMSFLMARGHFRIRMMSDTSSRLPVAASAVVMGGAVAVVSVAVLPVSAPSLKALAGLLGSLLVASLAAQSVGDRIIRRQWAKGNLRASALIYGSDDLARELAVEIDVRPDYGVDVVGFIADQGSAVSLQRPSVGVIYDTEGDVSEIIDRTGADVLIVGPGSVADDRNAIRTVRRAAGVGMPVFVVPRFFEMGLGVDVFASDRARGYPLVRLQRSAHPQVSIRLKRLFDVAVAGAVLLLASPLILLVAALVKITSPGPVLFAQERVGQHGRPILIRKFRSMAVNRTSDAEWTADQRVTCVGHWLRRLSLDELPQLFSVLTGEMSLVGPRPERPAFVEKFIQEVPDYDDRHRMPVGMTGLAQIVGLRGDTSIPERIKYDNLYIDQWSFVADLQILAQTVTAILRQNSTAKAAVELDRALGGASVLGPPSGDHRSGGGSQ